MEYCLYSAEQLFAEVKTRLEACLSAPNVVCFDFFDTLVQRTVPPEETKRIAARQLAAALGRERDGEFLYSLRSRLEERLCSQNRARGFDPEFNLSSLAASLHDILRGVFGESFDLDTETFRHLLLAIEVAVEKEVQRLDPHVAAILRHCHQAGVQTAIVSDFYLPGAVFGELLIWHGLEEMVDKVFVSADHLLTKGHGGRLYDVVAQAYRLPPESFLMLGDNGHADVRMANQRGMIGLCLSRRDGGKGKEQITVPAGSSRVAEYRRVFEAHRAGSFPEMGLSLHLFTHRLFLQSVRDKVETLFFCSKEGEFLRRLFMRYQEIRFGRQLVGSEYLLVSRKATYICGCRPLADEDFSGLFDYYRDQSLVEFLQSLNFSEDESSSLCRCLSLDGAIRHYDLKNHADFATLLASSSFRSSYEKHRHQQRTNFLAYLQSFGGNFPCHGLALVDVGWKGSIQNNIFRALDGKVSVKGYYLGLLSPSGLEENNRKSGVLFSDTPCHSPFIHVYNNNRSLFEMTLGASHGSADGYFQDEELGAARRSSRYRDGQGVVAPLATVLDLPEERRLYQQRVAPLQEVYSELNDSLCALLLDRDGSFPEPSWWARQHARMVFTPSRAEIDLYSELYHLENFGLFEFTSFARGEAVPLATRLANLLALVRDPAALLETGVWPPIILRRLGLDFLIPFEGAKRHKLVFGSYR